VLIFLPASLILHERHLFLQCDRFDSSIFPPEAAAVWNSCSLPLQLIHLSCLCKSQLKTIIFSFAPISISLALFSFIKQSCTWLRIHLVCKMLQSMPSLQRQLFVAFKGTKNLVQWRTLKHTYLNSWNSSNQNHTCFTLGVHLY